MFFRKRKPKKEVFHIKLLKQGLIYNITINGIPVEESVTSFPGEAYAFYKYLIDKYQKTSPKIELLEEIKIEK